MIIKGFQKLTLLDYKGYLAATVFTGGCNFKCPFCHNKDLVLHAKEIPSISSDEIIETLKSRKKRLEAVCISGGEPTLQPDLPFFIKRIKDLGYRIKLDTNGYRPDVLENLLNEQLLDYIAMDIKNSKDKYSQITNVNQIDINKIEHSIQIIKSANCDYEFRTTVIKELHDASDIQSIAQWIADADHYYLQAYRDSKNVIKPIFTSYSKEELKEFKRIAEQYVKNVEIVGV